jgi:hypothetical protein
MIGRENRSTQRKPAPVPLWPPPTPHALLGGEPGPPGCGSQRLTVWATERPVSILFF